MLDYGWTGSEPVQKTLTSDGTVSEPTLRRFHALPAVGARHLQAAAFADLPDSFPISDASEDKLMDSETVNLRPCWPQHKMQTDTDEEETLDRCGSLIVVDR